MFKTNRKRNNLNGTFLLQTALALAACSVLALGYVWAEMSGDALGERIKQLEREITDLQRRYDHEVWLWESAASPSNIEEALRQHDIVMVWPDEMNIVRLEQTDTAVASLQDLAGQVAQLGQSAHQSAHD